MSIDTCVLLRIRDRPLFRRLVEAFAEARRWEGDDGFPTLWPLDDGSVLVGTVIRWDDGDMEIEVRAFLQSLAAGRLAEVHDDPRGVYLCTDVAPPRQRTYEGAVAELGGRFVHPDRPGEDASSESQRAFVTQPGGTSANEDGAVSVLLPAPVAQLVDRGAVPRFEVEYARRIGLEGGDALYITNSGGDAAVVAAWLGAACIREGIDRERVGPCAFFRDWLAQELEATGVTTASEALAALGDRAQMLSLLTREERAREDVARARAWLAEKG